MCLLDCRVILHLLRFSMYKQCGALSLYPGSIIDGLAGYIASINTAKYIEASWSFYGSSFSHEHSYVWQFPPHSQVPFTAGLIS